ncbi:MAG TPA: SurA N-terminal domain-containing protein, partial [Chitinophagaceae bacterium]|nr:SurA N-terminal domain-containing protein [Chitinophagaceae bacterium]
MSVIQTIRDKYARVMAIAIALSLLGFIVMDAFSGRSNLFGGSSTTIGSINGEKIEYMDFARKVDAEVKSREANNQGGNDNTMQAVEAVWNQEVETALLKAEVERLGLKVTDKEVNDWLFGDNPPQDLAQNFPDRAAIQQYFISLRNQSAEVKAQTAQYLESLEFRRLYDKYMSLISNSVYFPKWFIEKQNADAALMARASYVNIPYAVISDTAVSVSADEIRDYMNDHKKEFELKEETRSVNYV